MNALHSVLVAVDGPSKAGSTFFMDAVAAEATHQGSAIPRILADARPESVGGRMRPSVKGELAELQRLTAFRSIVRISAGNAFRAAALHVISEAAKGHAITTFNNNPEAAQSVLSIFQDPGQHDRLQHDPAIGVQVSKVAQMAGVQVLCRTVFCNAVVSAYNANGGGNLVIADARGPVEQLLWHGSVGSQPGKIEAASILPVYIHTPVDISAARLGGNLQEKIAYVAGRRRDDAERTEFPVIVPDELIEDYDEWLKQFAVPAIGGNVALPLRIDNGAANPANIQYLGGMVASLAQGVAYTLGRRV